MTEQFKNFDPKTVAQIEAGMWRDYYWARESGTQIVDRVKSAAGLYTGLATLTREQFGFNRTQALAVSTSLFCAALVFGFSKNNRFHVQDRVARPILNGAYSLARRFSESDFNPKEVARHELAWWQAHRGTREDSDLKEKAILEMAALFSEIYRVNENSVMPAAERRIEAAIARDQISKVRLLTETDWDHIQDDLIACYKFLHTAVQSK